MRDSAVTSPASGATPNATRRIAPIRNTVLVTTMVSTAFQIFVISVLASVLLEDFDLSRFQIGLIGSLNTAVGALTAPVSGRVTDRIGARRSTIVAQLWTACGFVVMANANSVVVLIASAVILGVPQGWGNPATNALIAERVPAGNRGVVTGIKQSGVQVGIFLAGVSLPTLADWIGWRGAMWAYAVLFGAFALIPLLLPRDPALENPPEATDSTEPARPYDMRAVWLIALYAFLMGTGGGAIGRFLALFAEEEAGLSTTAAGLVLALSGLAGIGVRILAGRLAEHRIEPLPLLAILASIGSIVAVLLLITLQIGAWLLWPIALLFAVGHAAWNAVAMLAIILGVDRSQAGRASGAVMFGFLGGLAVGAPIAGLVIDATDSYQPVWSGALVLAVASATVARFAHRTART
ncbi:MAG: MFS transporter [Actinomycetota bacterium]